MNDSRTIPANRITLLVSLCPCQSVSISLLVLACNHSAADGGDIDEPRHETAFETPLRINHSKTLS